MSLFVSQMLIILYLVISVSLVGAASCPIPHIIDKNIYILKNKNALNLNCYDPVTKVNVFNITFYCINGLWSPPLITNNCRDYIERRKDLNKLDMWFKKFKPLPKNHYNRPRRSPNVGKFEALKRHELVDKKISEGILETTIDPNTPRVVRVHPGGKAFLLCRVENLGTNSVMWYFGDRVLSIDTSIFIPDKRLFLSFDIETGTWILEINEVRMRDEGTYTCQVSNKPRVRHAVKLQVVPNGKPLLPLLRKKRRRRKKNVLKRVNEEEKQSLAIEELRQNLSSIWSELSGLKVILETHIKETDPQNYYDPRDDQGYGHEADHYDHHGHHDGGHHQGGHHEGGHHDEHHHDPHFQGSDHHQEGDHQHEAIEGKTQESGYSYDDHHHHYEDYDHHHHHEDYHHQQHEGGIDTHDHQNEDHHHNQRHHHEDEDHHHEDESQNHQEEKDDDSHEDNSEENQSSGKAPLKSVNLLGSSKVGESKPGQKVGESKPGQKSEEDQYRGYWRMRQEFLKARCNLHPNAEIPESNVTGHITISQKKDATGPLYFKFHLKGFDVSHENGIGFVHGFHIHENAIQEHKCSSAGAHFNPFGYTHGAPYDVIRHVGDLGNIRVDNQGRFDNRIITDDQVTFIGKNSIIGRSIVVHEKADDFGLGGDEESLKTGNAGARLACCTIESINVPKAVKPAIRFNG